jgi:hypothetical protein
MVDFGGLNMTFKKWLSAMTLSVLASVACASSGDFTVGAAANSTSGGTGLSTLSLLSGQQFSVSVNTNDLWNAGDLPRWSNANGLVGNLYYSVGTDSEVPAYAVGTQIGAVFPMWSQNSLIAPYGSLVGQIGSGSWFTIGTNFTATASSAGVLKLYYFDSNNYDNTGSIRAHVTAVPEPETYALLLAGLAVTGLVARRRKMQGRSHA